MEPATIIYRPWRYIIYTSGGKFHQEQSFSTDGDLLFGHKLSPNEPFWPSWQDILEKIWGYKDTGSFFVTLFLSSFTVEVSSLHELQTDFRPPFAYSLSHSFQSTLNCYRASCHPPMLCLLSILLSIRTIITQPFYQTFFIQHGLVHTFLGLVLRLLLFFRSVKLFCLHVLSQPYFFFPQRTTRPKVTVASPSVQVRYPFLRSISDIDVYPPSISDSHS